MSRKTTLSKAEAELKASRAELRTALKQRTQLNRHIDTLLHRVDVAATVFEYAVTDAKEDSHKDN